MKHLSLLLSAIVLVCACDRQDPYSADNSTNTSSNEISHEMIVLGDRLDDPYTVQNMTKAVMSLYPAQADRGEIKATDLYVRFLPSGEDDCKLLQSLGVSLVDHPLDYEILQEGDYYRDPSVSDEQISWQYAVVDKDFDFPDGIPYELIDECYIAENASEQTKAAFGDIDWEAVEREAFKITGNEKMLVEPVKGKYPATAPKGRITIMDEKYSKTEIGVAGVRVSCNVFVKFAHAYTDESGNYAMPKTFTSDVRYRLVFKNKVGFNIGFNLILVPASVSTLGKASPDGVSINVNRDSERKLFTRCVVNNAGYEYVTRCKENGYTIKTPPSNLRIWLFQNMNTSSAPMLQQGALIDNSVLANYLGAYLSLVKMFLPDITLGLKGMESYEDIYNAAVHEFAHASHFAQVGKGFWDKYIKYIIGSFVTSGFTTYGVGTEQDHGYCEVGEMWAYYCQSRYHRDRYKSKADYGGNNWFSPQTLIFLDEHGFDRFKIFKALTSDVTDREKFQNKLISLYPESKSIINQAFDRYE